LQSAKAAVPARNTVALRIAGLDPLNLAAGKVRMRPAACKVSVVSLPP
jgi:hypothetical protein